MIFPFEVTFTKKLSGEIEKFSTSDILDFYKNYYKKSGAESVKLIDDCIVIRNYWINLWLPSTWNKWYGITSATYQIAENANKDRVAIFKINLSLVLIIGAVLGIMVGVSVHAFWIGFAVFMLLGVLIWATTLFRNSIDFEDFILEKRYNLSKNNLNNI
jgi:hypothetical protein